MAASLPKRRLFLPAVWRPLHSDLLSWRRLFCLEREK